MIYDWPGLKDHHMYDKSSGQIAIGKIDTVVDFKVGVKPGNIMDPVLFLILMMDFSGILEDEWTSLELSIYQFSREDNSPISTEQLVSHQPGTFTYGTIFDILYMLYVGKHLFIFESSTDIKRGINLLSDHFARFGLEMHIGTVKIYIKNWMHILPASVFLHHVHFISHWPH